MAIQANNNISSVISIKDTEQADVFFQWMDSLPSQPLSGAFTLTVVAQEEIETTIDKVIHVFVLVCPNMEQREALRDGMKALAQNIRQLLAMKNLFVIESQAKLNNDVKELVKEQEGIVLNNDLLQLIKIRPNSHACSLFTWQLEEREEKITTNRVSFEYQSISAVFTRQLGEGKITSASSSETTSTTTTKAMFLREKREDWFDS